LREGWFSRALKANNFVAFREYHRTIEEICKPKSENPNLYTLAGQIIIEREKKPLINQSSLANADLVLSQMSRVFDITSLKSGFYWFPTLYCYFERQQDIWVKLVSKTYCHRIFSLFAVDTIHDLKEKVKSCVFDEKARYSGSFDPAPVILTSIKLEEIATLP
jgi:hypothetical protein